MAGVFRASLGDVADAQGINALLDHCAAFETMPLNEWRGKCRRKFDEAPRAAEALRRIAQREEILPVSVDHTALGFVRGVMWALPLTGADEAIPLLVRVADQAGRPGLGKPHAAVAATAVRALGSVGGERTLAPLRRLRSEAPLARVRKVASGELDRVLAQAGLTRAEVPDWCAQTFELNGDGERTIQLEKGYSATVRLVPGGSVKVRYRAPNGQTMGGKPTAGGMADGTAEVTALAAAIRSVVNAEKFRLRQLMTDQRVLAVGEWLRNYLDHPVTGALSRTLIWEYSADSGEHWEPGLPVLADDGTWRLWTVEKERLDIAADATVRVARVMKPSSSTAAFWRRRLRRMEIKQALPQVD